MKLKVDGDLGLVEQRSGKVGKSAAGVIESAVRQEKTNLVTLAE